MTEVLRKHDVYIIIAIDSILYITATNQHFILHN